MTLPAHIAADIARFLGREKVTTVRHFFGPINAGYVYAVAHPGDITIVQRELYDWMVAQGYEFNPAEIPKALLNQLAPHERPTGTAPGKYPLKRSQPE